MPVEHDPKILDESLWSDFASLVGQEQQRTRILSRPKIVKFSWLTDSLEQSKYLSWIKNISNMTWRYKALNELNKTFYDSVVGQKTAV